MKDIIWLSPSLAAGAIAARVVVFFERRPQMSSASRRGTYSRLPPILSRQQAVQNGKQRVDKILARILAAGAVVLVASSCYHKTADTPPEPAIGDNHPAARPVAAPTT